MKKTTKSIFVTLCLTVFFAASASHSQTYIRIPMANATIKKIEKTNTCYGFAYSPLVNKYGPTGSPIAQKRIYSDIVSWKIPHEFYDQSNVEFKVAQAGEFFFGAAHPEIFQGMHMIGQATCGSDPSEDNLSLENIRNTFRRQIGDPPSNIWHHEIGFTMKYE